MNDAATQVHLREVTDDDIEGVTTLHQEVGFTPPDAAHWRWLWGDNPARELMAGDWPRGWVLERDGLLGGYIANLPLAYALGERDLGVAVPRALITSEQFASQGLRLVSQYLKQRGPDLLLCTTANSKASPIWDAFRAKRVPQPGLDAIMFWPLSADAFIAASATKLGVPSVIARHMGTLGGPFLRAESALRTRGIPRPTRSHTVTAIHPADIDGEFDDLWDAKRRESVALRASRSADILRWHFAGRPQAAKSSDRDIVVFKLLGRPGIQGYAVSETRHERKLELTRTRLVDLVVLGEDKELITHLLWHVQEHARAIGSHVLEASTLLPASHEVALAGRPFSRSVAAWSYFYKCRGSLREELKSAERWALTPFDGDTSL